MDGNAGERAGYASMVAGTRRMNTTESTHWHPYIAIVLMGETRRSSR